MTAQILSIRASWRISDRATLVLLRMAHSALDHEGLKHPARQYWGGWELLGMALGYEDPTSSAAQSAVARAVRELTERGLLKRVGEQSSRRGHACYELTLWGGIP